MRNLCTLAVVFALAALGGCADGPTAATDPEPPTPRLDTGPGSGSHVVPGDSATVITTSGGGTVMAPAAEGEEDEEDTEDGGGGLGSGN